MGVGIEEGVFGVEIVWDVEIVVFVFVIWGRYLSVFRLIFLIFILNLMLFM